MKLIFIYGPPAVGKYTVGESLSEITKFSLFHNHLTFDLAASIFEPWTPLFFNYCKKLRLDIFRKAVKYNKNMIFTFAYSKQDKKFVDKAKAIVNHIYFVQLTAPIEEINKRVEEISRRKYKKLQTREQFQTYCERYTLFDRIDADNHIVCDTFINEPVAVARKIVESFGL